MNTFAYKGWHIHETFLSKGQAALSHENGVSVLSPTGETIPVKSVHAAKCLITRRKKK